jgi:hypothetical protein
MSDSARLPQEKGRLATLAVQLLVVPLAVVLFCVALGGLFVWLTSERKTFEDYLQALRSSSGERQSQQAQFLLNYIQESKRWQGIFDVTAQMSADRHGFLQQNPNAVAQIAQVFEEAAGRDPKTRRYLALVLGLLGDGAAVPVLRKGLEDRDAETVKNCVWALGRLEDEGSALRIMELARHEEQSVRLMAVYALGLLRSAEAGPVLRAALEDRDELVRWNAAFALARRGERAARPVLLSLLDNEHVARVMEAMPPESRPVRENVQRYRVAAVVWLAKLEQAEAIPVLQRLSVEEPDLAVRNAAMRQLQELRRQ